MHIMKNVPVVMRIAVTHTVISRKVVRESPCDNPERYCGWFWVHCSSKKFERMALEATDICLRVLNASNKSTATVIRNNVLIISHIIFRDCHLHIFSDKTSCPVFSNIFIKVSFFLVWGMPLGTHQAPNQSDVPQAPIEGHLQLCLIAQACDRLLWQSYWSLQVTQ